MNIWKLKAHSISTLANFVPLKLKKHITCIDSNYKTLHLYSMKLKSTHPFHIIENVNTFHLHSAKVEKKFHLHSAKVEKNHLQSLEAQLVPVVFFGTSNRLHIHSLEPSNTLSFPSIEPQSRSTLLYS